MAAPANSTSSHSDQSWNLSEEIAKSFQSSVFPEGTETPFIPKDSIEVLVNPSSVMKELFGSNFTEGSTSSKREVDDLINYVTSSAKKLLVISILSKPSCGLRAAMEKFNQYEFGDNDLPLLIEDLGQYPPCFEKWDTLGKRYFRKEQWTVLVPEFLSAFRRIKLRPEHILPFTYVDNVRKEGTFGDVYQVTILESHQEDPMRKPDGSLANAAIKELKASAATGELGDNKEKAQKVFKEWQAEAQALEDTSGLKHEHIVTVKSTFTKGPRHYFMFQWADGGSLRDLYKGDPRPNLTERLVEEITQQLRGLSDALSALHNYRKDGSSAQPGLLGVPAQNDESYRHGDLKPENILIFKDNTEVGVWKIADMGLAKHHVAATYERGPTSTLNATPSYEPPEVWTLPNEGRSRQYDCWSMGCIILELLVWLLYGPDALINFIKSLNGETGQKFPYWEFVPGTNKKEAQLRGIVLDYISHIQDDHECQHPTAIKDLLRIVKDRLLVVNLPANRPSGFASGGPVSAPISGPKRAKAEALCTELEEICHKGKREKAYWFTGRKRSEFSGPSIMPETSHPTTPEEPKLQVRFHHVEDPQ